ncbi:hypothetical protein TNCV_4415891 [Trichonephila clavipes]|uniref:Uncharacterized protein n=1 Tax=Trichonephila clavipes TaxID=2585209 RepID=A0A8X6RZ66_TRICX|nr:hypothetical protein TNCV_4415891 [Trichonephila clavipes]
MSYGLVRGALAVGHWNQAVLQLTADHLGVGKQQWSEFPEDTFRQQHCRRADSLSSFATAFILHHWNERYNILILHLRSDGSVSKGLFNEIHRPISSK